MPNSRYHSSEILETNIVRMVAFFCERHKNYYDICVATSTDFTVYLQIENVTANEKSN